MPEEELRRKGFDDSEIARLRTILEEQDRREWLWKHIKRFAHFLVAAAVAAKAFYELWKSGWLG